MKKRLLCTLLAMALILSLLPGAALAGDSFPIVPRAYGTQQPAAEGSAQYHRSGGASVDKLTKREIVELLTNAPTSMPSSASEIFDEMPSVTAPYDHLGVVKPALLEQTVNRLNALRLIAGVPTVTLDDDLCRKAQYGAIILAKIGYLSHTPPQPKDMDDTFYEAAYSAASSSNLYAGMPLTLTPDGFMADSDSSNISRVGHRQWQLNPKMGKIGFGYALSESGYSWYTDEWVFDRSGDALDYDFIAWPSSGYFPNQLFKARTAWSINLNTGIFSNRKFQEPTQADIQVTLVRESDGRTWHFSDEQTYKTTDPLYFNVLNSGYVYAGDDWNTCIIFRPDDITQYDGIYTVTVDGVRDQSGNAVELSYQVDFFDATPQALTESMFTVDTDAETYSGAEITKSISSRLSEGEDYTVSYSGNVDAGTATLTLTGKGLYYGTVTYSFQIRPKPLEEAMVSQVTDRCVYSGSAFTPAPAVTDGGRALTAGTDYTCSYRDNIQAGTAAVTVTGTGNYGGSVTRTFQIEKAERSITLPSGSLTLAGDTLTAQLEPAYPDADRSAKPSFESGDTSVVSVDAGGLVTGLENGRTTVTVTIPETANYSAASKSIPVVSITAPVTGVSVSGLGDSSVLAQISGRTVTLTGYAEAGDTLTLTPVYADGASGPASLTLDLEAEDLSLPVSAGNAGMTYAIDAAGVTAKQADIAYSATVVPSADALEDETAREIVDAALRSEHTGAKDLLAASIAQINAVLDTLDRTGYSEISAAVELQVNATEYRETSLSMDIRPVLTVTGTTADEAAEILHTETLTALPAPIEIQIQLPEGFPTASLFAVHAPGTDRAAYLPVRISDGTAAFSTAAFSPFILTQVEGRSVVTYVGSDGTIMKTVTYDASHIGETYPAVSKSGSTFQGWSPSETASSASYAGTLTLANLQSMGDTVTLYPVFSSSGGKTGGGSTSPGSNDGGGSDNNGDNGGTAVIPVVPTISDAPVNPFTDVRRSDYYYEPVLWAVDEGITNGTSDTTFSPEASCTRGEMVTFLWRAAGEPAPKSGENPFTDVDVTKYYGKAVLWAVEQGITNGTSDTTFSPGETVNRAQAVTFLYRSARVSAPAGSSGFSDVDETAFYADAVRWAVKNGITNGTGGSLFSPNDRCVRGQIVTFLYRYYEQ